MRVLYTAPSWPRSLSANGITSYVSALLPELHRMGVDTSVLARTIAPGLHAEPDVHAISDVNPGIIDRLLWKAAPGAALHRSLSLSLSNAVDRVCAKTNVDIIESDEAYAPALPLARRQAPPVVVRLHGPWFLDVATLREALGKNF